MLTAGSAADRLGRRRVLLVGLALFGLISLSVIWVDSAGQLITLRAALGVAAAMMAPITNSLVFRLFEDQALRMRAMTVMIVVGMSGFILGPLLGGTALAHVRWEWLLVVNAPIALMAFVGVRLGVPADSAAGLTNDKLDLPGAILNIATIGLACYTATSGVDHGPVRAGLANLPLIITMLVATPVPEWLGKQSCPPASGAAISSHPSSTASGSPTPPLRWRSASSPAGAR